MTPRLILGGLAVVALAMGTSGQPSAQAPPAGAASDALLAEVRALRAELNQAAGASIRTQLLVGRLQLQEQRINTVAKQLDETRLLLSTFPSRLMPMQNQLKQLETEARDPSMTQDRRQAIDLGITQMKARIADTQKQFGDLTEKESGLAQMLANEQGRWSDFNTRLDDIERELSSRAR
jgi:chromosome segregation ATPase